MRLRRLWSALAFVYSAFVFYGTLFPFVFNGYLYQRPKEGLYPFYWIFTLGEYNGRADIVANIIFFIPLGYFLGKLLYGFPKLILFLIGGFYCFFLTGLVEYLQLYVPHRHTSVLDIITNIGGGILGLVFASYLKTPHLLAGAKRQFRQLLSSRWVIPMFGVFILVICEGLQPFNFSLKFDYIQFKMKHFWPSNFPAGYLILLARYGAVFAMASAIASAWLYEAKVKRPALKGFLMMAMLGSFLEFFQILVLSRIPGWPELILLNLASAFGSLVFLYMPQKKIWATIPFWLLIGFAVAELFSASNIINMDVYRLRPIRQYMITSWATTRMSSWINHLSLFFFLGLIVPYFIYRFRISPKLSLVNIASFGFGFLFTAISLTKFSPIQSSFRFLFPLVGSAVGFAIFIWSLGMLKELHRARQKSSLN